MEQVIAIDIGYGDTKVVVGDKYFKFASAIEKRNLSQANFESKEIDVYEFKGTRYTVGDKALTNAVSTRGFNFLVKYSSLLIYHAIKLADFDIKKPIKIITGLSLVNWQDKEEFLKSISSIKVNDDIFSPEITLMAQGQGVFYDYSTRRDGVLCVVDMGYNTFDFLVFENDIPRKDLSFATKKGAHSIITELQTKLRNKFQFDITEQSAKEIFFNGSFKNYGEIIDLSEEIEDLKTHYTDFIIDELKTQRAELLRTADIVIFSGGGAYYLEDNEFPKNVRFSEKPYEYANVRGYLRFAKEQLEDGKEDSANTNQ